MAHLLPFIFLARQVGHSTSPVFKLDVYFKELEEYICISYTLNYALTVFLTSLKYKYKLLPAFQIDILVFHFGIWAKCCQLTEYVKYLFQTYHTALLQTLQIYAYCFHKTKNLTYVSGQRWKVVILLMSNQCT